MDAPAFPEVIRNVKQQVEELIRDYILGSSPSTLPISRDFIDLLNSTKHGTGDGKEIFNYCLCNHYRGGEEYMGYHADDEASLDTTVPIASVTFGVTRSFDVRPRKKTNDGKKSRVARVALGDGDLQLMFSPMQQHYEHAIPVEKRVSGERINLTFRRIVTK
jgi:alkylated DNA repair dioxygenase AlkB